MVDEQQPPRRRPPVLGVLGAVLALGVGTIIVVNHHNATREQPPTPTVSATSSLRPPTTAPSSSASTGTAGPSTVVVGHPLLGVTGGWNLFGLGPGVMVRIEMARGRVETTPVPSLGSGAPLSFVAGSDRVLIRPIDAVAGYVIPDGAPAEQAKGALASGGFVFRGPDPAHVWVQAGTETKPVMSLVGLDGSSSGTPSIPIPPDMSPFGVQTDGSGSLIFQGTSGSYAASGATLRRITTGRVVAAWPDGWLVGECDDQHRCSTEVIDRRTGTRRTLGPDLGPNALLGVASADGRFAAVLVSQGESASPMVIDLRSGARRLVPVALSQTYGDGSLVWSPDGRWLLVVASDHTIKAVEASTWRVTSLGVTLPPVDQLAVRP